MNDCIHDNAQNTTTLLHSAPKFAKKGQICLEIFKKEPAVPYSDEKFQTTLILGTFRIKILIIFHFCSIVYSCFVVVPFPTLCYLKKPLKNDIFQIIIFNLFSKNINDVGWDVLFNFLFNLKKKYNAITNYPLA